MVRLAFHDAAGGGGRNGLGGSNGCLDPNSTDHNGLSIIVSQYESVFTNNPTFSAKISRADLWVLGAQLALQFSTISNGNLQRNQAAATPITFSFRYGRIDDNSCVGLDDGLLPAAGIDYSGMTALFSTRIGMNAAELSSIMGAHSLGKTTFSNSGFSGSWTQAGSSFSNLYFRELIGVPWNNNNSSNVWLGPASTIMLRADVEPLYSPALPNCRNFVDESGPPRNPGCAVNSEGSVVSFAQNQALFYSTFQTAWSKLVDFESGPLREATLPSSASKTSIQILLSLICLMLIIM